MVESDTLGTGGAPQPDRYDPGSSKASDNSWTGKQGARAHDFVAGTRGAIVSDQPQPSINNAMMAELGEAVVRPKPSYVGFDDFQLFNSLRAVKGALRRFAPLTVPRSAANRNGHRARAKENMKRLTSGGVIEGCGEARTASIAPRIAAAVIGQPSTRIATLSASYEEPRPAEIARSRAGRMR